MRPKFILLITLLLSAVFTHAATFVVTSNAERGAGTFAEALQNAAANDTTEQDYITFNLPGNTADAHTILLTASLPDITSNVEIDGTTQPGNTFGVSDAKVCLQWKAYAAITIDFLHFVHANKIKILGLMFRQPFWNGDIVSSTSAIHFTASNNITIGQPGKGNYFSGFHYCINTLQLIDSTGSQIYEQSSGITVQSNIFGLNPAGNHDENYNGDYYYTCEYAMRFFNLKDVLIGGDDPKEGNFIYAYHTLLCYSDHNIGNGFVKITNNKIGTDISGTIDNEGASSTVFTDIALNAIQGSNGINDQSVEIKSNTIVGQIELYQITSYYKIQSNKIFSTNWSGEFYPLISTDTCHGIIGGETDAEGNDIYAQSYANSRYFGQEAINFVSNTEVKHNTIHCNRYEGSSVNLYSEARILYQSNNQPWIVTDVLKPGYVEGRACKHCRVDVYEDDECHACEGKVFLGSVTAGDDGKWSFSGSFNGSVVAMATDATATTSGFSAPWVITDSEKVVQPDCHSNNGSIKELTLIGANRYEWKKITLNPAVGEVATFITNSHLDLDSLAPGTYELSPGFGSTCNGVSQRFILKDNTYIIDDKNVQITQPSCGGNNGAVMWLGVNNPDQTNSDGFKSLVWKNVVTNKVVDSVLNLQKVFAGNYKLYVTSNGGCIDSSKLYSLVNQSGPTLNVSSVSITNETCSSANGSILGIAIQNASGNLFVQWEDDKGKVWSNDFQASHLPAGRYRLQYKDESACDTITTSYYTIANNGVINIDESKKQVTASACTVNDGAITGITASNADTYQWTNVDKNTTVVTANKPDILNIPADTYQLSVSNSFGCTAKSSTVTVPQSSFAMLTLSKVQYNDADCNKDNGFIHPVFTNDISTYRFQWIDSLQNNPVSNTVVADNLTASSYYLMATDSNHCQQKLLSQTLQQLGVPLIDDSRMNLTNDVCHTSKGTINNLKVTGGSGGYIWQWYAASGNVLNVRMPDISSLPEGSYYTVVTDKDGCAATSSSYTIQDTTADLPVPFLQAKDVFIGTAATITVSNAGTGNYELYHNPTDPTPVATTSGSTLTTPPITQDDTWYVRNINGNCSSPFAKINIAVIRKTRLSIPSAFSPNGDGKNDTWRIGLQGIAGNFKLIVYSRYGQPVFSSSDINKNWNGKLNGVLLPQGSYVYIIQLTDDNGKSQQLSGMVTLVY